MWPLIEVAVEAKSGADRKNLGIALTELAAGDASFAFHADFESGQIIMGGVDEQHLDRKAGLLLHDYKLDLNIGAFQVAYRETLGIRAYVDYTHDKHLGPTSQFARVRIVFEPGEHEAGFTFDSQVDGDLLPQEYVSGVERGLAAAKESGLLAGFPVIDFKATLIGGAYRDTDSSMQVFEIGARAAFRELREKGAPFIVEPIMRVEVLTPDEHIGDAILDLNSRRGAIHDIEPREEGQRITADVPLANMFGYSNNLRAMSHGQASFSMRYSHYERSPRWPEPPDDLYSPAIGMRA